MAGIKYRNKLVAAGSIEEMRKLLPKYNGGFIIYSSEDIKRYEMNPGVKTALVCYSLSDVDEAESWQKLKNY